MSLQNSLQYQIVSKLKTELDIAEYDVTELISILFKIVCVTAPFLF